MNGLKDISRLNKRVTIKQWRNVQDNAAGTSYDEEVTSFEVWANKKNRTGSNTYNAMQPQWNYETTFTIRHDERVKSNFTVDSDGQRYKIDSIEIDNDAYKGMMKLRCTTTDIGLNIS